MAKISVYEEWIETLPSDSLFIFAFNGKNYSVKLSTLFSSGGGGPIDPGSPSPGDEITDYIYHISEIPNGIITTFTLRYDYFPGSCKVYVSGSRQTLSRVPSEYDYEEIGNKQINFTIAPEEGTLLVVDYIYSPPINNICEILIDYDNIEVEDEDSEQIYIDECL